MLSSIIGAVVMGLIFNGVVDAGWIGETSKFYGLMSLDFWHIYSLGIGFGIVYMATDPVTHHKPTKENGSMDSLLGLFRS